MGCCCKVSQRFSFYSMMFLTSSYFVVEIVVGYVTNSMAMVADSFHMLSDLLSLLVGFTALRLATKDEENQGNRVPTDERYTFGWVRAEILGALVNSVFLLALCFSIIVQACKRLIVPEPIENPRLVLIAGGVGLLVNILGLALFHQHGHSHGGHGHSHGEKEDPAQKPMIQVHRIQKKGDFDPITMENVNESKGNLGSRSWRKGPKFRRGSEEASSSYVDEGITNITIDNDEEDTNQSAGSMNARGVYLHVLGDALGSVIVMISALVILLVGSEAAWTKYLDPALSLFMVLIIMKTSVPLLRESSAILMQTVPTHLKIQEIKDKLVLSCVGVLSVHELHIWQLAGNKIIASAHVHCRYVKGMTYLSMGQMVKQFFHEEGIHSTTIQLEFIDDMQSLSAAGPNGSCLFECDSVCSEKMCCSPNISSAQFPLDVMMQMQTLENIAECSTDKTHTTGTSAKELTI